MFTSSRMLIACALLICCIIGDASAQTQEKAEQKAQLFQAIESAFDHCKKIEVALLNPYSLVEAYQNHYNNSDFEKKLSDSQQVDLLKYFEGRKDIPDFGFIIPNYESLMPRVPRIKFNAIITSQIQSQIGFKSIITPFEGNCEMQEFEQIDDSEVELILPIAFATEQRILKYKLSREDGYGWQIEDLRVGENASLIEQHGTPYSKLISQGGFDLLIENLCKTSDFSRLGCEE